MSHKVYVRRAAELDIARAQIWYETQQAGLAAQFHSEITATMNILSETPFIYPVLYRDVRRAVSDIPGRLVFVTRIQSNA